MAFVKALSLLVGAAGLAQSTRIIPSRYHAKATMTMPYYDLVEPIEAWYDEEEGLGRLDYWQGVDSYFYNASGPSYQVVPTTSDGIDSDETCFLDGSNIAPISIFPDMTYFPEEPEAGPCTWRGTECEAYTLKSPTYNDTTGFDGNYTLYTDIATGLPLAFHFVGFNVILGSHYDEYIFDYLVVDADPPPTEIFEAPTASMDCVQLETDDDDSGGPTHSLNFHRPAPTTLTTPLSDLMALLPGGESENTQRFEAFIEKHAKTFESEAHKHHRAYLYHATERYVNAFNRQRKSFWLEVNHMADWTKEEKKKLLGRKHTPAGTIVPATTAHVATLEGELPDSVDWVAKGAVTPPKDQGTCGSCWSYGATGTTEGQVFLKTGELVPLSNQNLMDCSWPEGNNACDGGLDYRGYEWMLKHNGSLATEATYPYTNSDGFCRFTSSAVGAQISGYANLSGTVDDLNDALVSIGPISVSVDAEPDSFYFYAGGLYYDSDCLSGLDDLDHTVLAVGYTTVDGQKYTTVKNSWSDNWGDSGFIHVSQKDNCCGVATQPTYTILK